MSDTAVEQKISVEKEVELKPDEKEVLEHRAVDGAVIFPSLGSPAIVKKEENEDAFLELIVFCEVENLQRGEAMHHLRMAPWKSKDSVFGYKEEFVSKYCNDKELIKVSRPYKVSDVGFGDGDKSKDYNDDFKLKLGHMNPYPWIIESLKDFQYVYKISINLKSTNTGMYNIWWLTKEDYYKTREKVSWWNLIKHLALLLSGKHKRPRDPKKELKEFDEKVVDSKDENKNENIRATIYHPVYITKARDLKIGHLTDLHLDSRMELYAQSEASVIEVEENCPPRGTTEREVDNPEFHIPIKDKIANFNDIFIDLCKRLKNKKANMIVITGDLIDYNRGIHTPQTYKKEFIPISKMWEALGASVFKEDKYRDDRNWFLFYEKLLKVYDECQIPVYTLLGNHDYVNYAPSPWATKGFSWNGVYDQNLTLYESAISYGENYDSSKGFVADVDEDDVYAHWYSMFINPFADFVIDYEKLSLYMVDWGEEGKLLPLIWDSSVDSYYEHAGTLHQAKNLFKEGSKEFKNFSIYNSWINKKETKILFMHATAICPRDDISDGLVHKNLGWDSEALQYGTFVNQREKVLKSLELKKLKKKKSNGVNIIISGHSHRNIVMKLINGKKQEILGSGETYGKIETDANRLAIVSSSAGPLPKYLPGGPLICSCDDQYNYGFEYNDGNLFEYSKDKKNAKDTVNIDTNYMVNRLNELSERGVPFHPSQMDVRVNYFCPKCGMFAYDFEEKTAKRHRPGGTILHFNESAKKVRIESVPCSEKLCIPRLGVMCEENGFLDGGLIIDSPLNERDYARSDKSEKINLISKEDFKLTGTYELPSQVEYVTFLNKTTLGTEIGIRGKSKFNIELITNNKNLCKIKQNITKNEFLLFIAAGQKKKDFRFMRFFFLCSPIEKWDREVTCNKKIVRKTHFKSHKAKFEYEKDIIKGLVLNFKKKPDLIKRKKICGY